MTNIIETINCVLNHWSNGCQTNFSFLKSFAQVSKNWKLLAVSMLCQGILNCMFGVRDQWQLYPYFLGKLEVFGAMLHNPHTRLLLLFLLTTT